MNGRSKALLILMGGMLCACGTDQASSSTSGGGGSTASGGTTSAGGAGGAGGDGGAGGSGPDLVDTLAQHLTGRFDSVTQAMADPTYFEIQLETCEVPAPELGERVLYVEQAVMTSLEAPYRQRLYVVEPGPDAATQAQTTVYELADPMAFVGRCDDPSPTVAAADAIERVGCGVTLTWMTDHFVGGTAGMACSSTLQGATYATSEVSTYEDRIESWDRGYDAMDMQVWGAVAGAYVFDRKTPFGQQP